MARSEDASSRVHAIWVIVLVAWIVFIWAHSIVGGAVSDAESLWWVRIFDPFFNAMGVTADVSMRNHIVRKTAHFTEYLVLGIFITMALRPRWHTPRRGVAPAIALAVAVPCIDESIQLFIPGRTGQPSDVLLDICGAAVGFAIVALILRSQRKSKAR